MPGARRHHSPRQAPDCRGCCGPAAAVFGTGGVVLDRAGTGRACKGWDRYGERTPYTNIDIGKISETSWYVGFDIVRPTVQYGFQAALVKNVLQVKEEYQAFKLESRLHPSIWFKLAFTFKNKKS